MAVTVASREGTEADFLEAIRDVSHAIVARLNPSMAAEGFNPPMFWHLHYLERSGVKHPSELARRLRLSPATCTWSVDLLVGHGYVVRRPSERDRRQVVLEITPKGHRALESVWRRFDRSLREVLAPLPVKDVAITARTLRAVTDQFQDDPARSTPEDRR